MNLSQTKKIVNVIIDIIIVILIFAWASDYGYNKGEESGWVQYHEGKVECTKVFERVECRLIGEEK